MTRDERRALLGDHVIAHIHRCIDAAPEPSPEVVADLRRIMTRPAGPVKRARPADAA